MTRVASGPGGLGSVVGFLDSCYSIRADGVTTADGVAMADGVATADGETRADGETMADGVATV